MAGSQIGRLASSVKQFQDVRFPPVKANGAGKSIVTREEMQDFERQVNDRLQQIQTAFNDLAAVLKVER
jgi:hypothetical protein